MKLPALIPLIVMLAALTGCATPCYVGGAKNGLPACPATAQPTRPQDAISDAKVSGRVQVQATPERAVLMVETSTPDTVATGLAYQLEATLQRRNDERIFADRTETQQVYNNNAVSLTQTAAPAAARATKDYQSTETVKMGMFATSRADYATQTADAPRDQATAAAISARAKYADLEAAASPVAMILTPLAVIVLCALLIIAIRHPRTPQEVRPAVEYDDKPQDEPARELEPAADEWDDLPPGIDEQTMRKFMIYATTGKPLGAESMGEHWGTSPAQRQKRNIIMAHLEKHDHLERYAGAKRLGVSADIHWRVWLKNHSPAGINSLSFPENTLHAYDVHGSQTGGVGEPADKDNTK